MTNTPELQSQEGRLGRLMRPKLRENVWHIYPDLDSANLITTEMVYEVPTHAALAFLKMRTFCTGHNSIADIAGKSGFSVDDVTACLESLRPSGIIYSSDEPPQESSEERTRERLLKITNVWANELKNGYIGNQFASGSLSRDALVGWLLEMYHYIVDFPSAIAEAAEIADGPLRDLLRKFSAEERGHEIFVLRTLVNLGMKPEEVETSYPMLSTRMIGIVMRQLFQLEPSSVLLLAALVEAQEFNEDQIELLKQKLDDHYGVGAHALDPYFDHQRIDVDLGHQQMLEDNLHLLRIPNRDRLDQVVNKLHEVKHAFELQGLEISHYYNNVNGKYIPRQPVHMAAI